MLRYYSDFTEMISTHGRRYIFHEYNLGLIWNMKAPQMKVQKNKGRQDL